MSAIVGAGAPPDRVQLMAVMTRYGLVPAALKQAPRVGPAGDANLAPRQK